MSDAPEVTEEAKNLRARFGKLLREILKPTLALVGEQHEHTFLKTLGQEVAEEQGDRRPIPYAGLTVRGWLNGELLPSYATFNALIATLDKRYKVSGRVCDKLDIAYEAAQDWQANQISQPFELSHAMETLRKSADLTYRGLIPAMQLWNGDLQLSPETKWPDYDAQNPKATFRRKHATVGESNVLVHRVLTRRRQKVDKNPADPSRSFTVAISLPLAKIADNEGVDLLALHEMALRERADVLWETASRKDDIGGMIKAMRLRRGESLEEFGRMISSIQGLKKPLTPRAIEFWENNAHFPTGNEAGRRKIGGKIMYEALVNLMLVSDARLNPLSRSIPEGNPWFTEAMEQTFRTALLSRMKKMDSTLEFPADDCLPRPGPDSPLLQALARVYPGSLNAVLLEGHSSAIKR